MAETQDAVTCPTCGQEVDIYTGGEGTSSYVGKAEAERDRLREALERVVHEFNMWSEDANDGTYAYYRSDGLMTACVNARKVLGQ